MGDVMARPGRIQYENAIYHVMSRGVDRGMIFAVNDDYLRFLDCIERAAEKFQLEIFAFVLMGNHYHLFLRTKEANLAKAMQWLQTAYSVYHNRKHHRTGHLFQGRYKSIVVGEESYWQSLSLYIHLNPLRAGIVKELDEYKWSSYHDYVMVNKIHKWILCEEILKGFGCNKQEQAAKYQQLIIEKYGQEKKILEEIRYGLILGSDKFISWVQDGFIDKDTIKDKELPQKRMIGDNEIVKKVLDEIVKIFGVEQDSLLKRRRKIPDIGRDIGMYILKTHTGLNNKEIGEIFGVSLSAVNKAAIRVSEQMKQKEGVKKKVESIVNSVIKVWYNTFISYLIKKY